MLQWEVSSVSEEVFVILLMDFYAFELKTWKYSSVLFYFSFSAGIPRNLKTKPEITSKQHMESDAKVRLCLFSIPSLFKHLESGESKEETILKVIEGEKSSAMSNSTRQHTQNR